MPASSPTPASLPPRAAPASEVTSSVTVLDFFRLWHAYRVWFLLGLILTVGAALVWSKFVMVKFYRAEAAIFVGRQIPPEARAGLADLLNASGNARVDQYQNVVQATMAEKLLLSSDLLLAVAQKMRQPADPKKERPVDLAGLLGINEPNPELRGYRLVRVLRDLFKVRQVQTSGVIELSMELPRQIAAAQFLNLAIATLQERFTDLDFGYYDAELKVYEDQLQAEEALRADRTEQLAKEWDALRFDAYYPKSQKKEEFLKELELQVKRVAEIRDKIAKLRIGTSPEAKTAAQPVKVLDPATPPQKKSRPKTILNMVVAAALYTFLFMGAMALLGYAQWARRAFAVAATPDPATSGGATSGGATSGEAGA